MTALAPIRTIVFAGAAGGLVDFLYASGLQLSRGRAFEKLWQGVASGWIGKAAGEGGWATAVLGIATHFGIAIVMAAAYALAATRVAILYRRPVLSGVVYGFILYAVMYGIVLPARFGRPPLKWDGLISVMDIAAHIGVAVVLAFVLSRPRPAENSLT